MVTDCGVERLLASVPDVDLDRAMAELRAQAGVRALGDDHDDHDEEDDAMYEDLPALLDSDDDAGANPDAVTAADTVSDAAGPTDADPVLEAPRRWAQQDKFYPNCIWIPGTKHLVDNSLSDALHAMDGWPHFIDDLRCLEHLLKDFRWRDRLRWTCFKNTECEDLITGWQVSLKGSPTAITQPNK
jgi:hypothetical protein